MELGLKTPEGWGVHVYVYVHTCAWKGFGTFFLVSETGSPAVYPAGKLKT